MPHPLYFSRRACLGHDTGDHSERAERVITLEASLHQRNWLGYERRQAAPVDCTSAFCLFNNVAVAARHVFHHWEL